MTSDCPADPASPLPGRGPEHALLDAAVRGWSAGRAQFVEISGDPGIGKSALLQALAARCASAGALVLTGRAAPGRRGPAGLLGSPGPFLAPWSQPAPPPAGEPSPPPGRGVDLAAAVRLAAAAAAEGRPVALCLDDAHWLDAEDDVLAHAAVRERDDARATDPHARAVDSPSGLPDALREFTARLRPEDAADLARVRVPVPGAGAAGTIGRPAWDRAGVPAGPARRRIPAAGPVRATPPAEGNGDTARGLPDGDGARALDALLAAAAPGPLLVAYTVRPRQADARLLARPATVGAGWRTTQVAPAPLPLDVVHVVGTLDAAGAAGAAPGRGATGNRALLHRAAEGNPLYLRALAGLPDADLRALDHTAPDLTALPADVRCALSRDLAGLDPAPAALAYAAAVLTPPFSPHLLAQVAGLEPDAVLRPLAALTAADVLRADPVRPGHLRFRHPALRLMARAATPPGTLMLLHRRAAVAPALGAADPVERAPHLARTARPGDTSAAGTLLAAADAVLAAAPTLAAAWCDAARRLLPPSGAATLRRRATAALLLARARAADTSAVHDLAAEAGPELPAATVALLAAHLRRSGAPHAAAALLTAAARATGPTPAAAAAGSPAAAVPRDTSTRSKTRAGDVASHTSGGTGPASAAGFGATRSMDGEAAGPEPRVGVAWPSGVAGAGAAPAAVDSDGDSSGDGDDVVFVSAVGGGPYGAWASGPAVAAVAGDFASTETGDADGPRTRAARAALLRVQEAALELAAGAWDVADRVAGGVPADRPGGAALLAAHGTLALARAAAGDAVGRDRAARAAAAAADAVTDAELADHVDAVTRAGWACLAGGDDAAARRLFGRAARLAAATAQDAELPAAALGAACAAVRSGRLDDAVDRALDCEAAGGPLAVAARAVHAWALLLRDGAAAAAAPVERLLREAGPGTPLGAVAASLAAAVALTEGADGTAGTDGTAAARAGGPAEAHASVLAAVRAATALAVGMPSPPPARDEVLLGAALGASDPEAGVDLLRRAAEAFRAAGLTATACWLRLLLARRLLASGRLREAQAAVGVLKADADRCAAGGYLQRSAADLQRVLGSRAPRTGGDDRALSAREREIAGLVCRGLTNADIAGLLFISAKTVEAHLTHIFRKTGVRSRTALAGAMASGAAPVLLA